MRNVMTVFRREFASYFATPLAFVFIVIFLLLAGALAFYLGGFYASTSRPGVSPAWRWR
jgi:ABC-2 type transport system permease protein